ncbi:MAG: hypothetical protein K2H29_06865 [Oscillospiraceae bacterium]|nr:hypothetical protein [Oscillospiraceae bacterium]MDE5884775.1 hypothetical protein [Oscillospiraceae bacterium]
MNSDDIIQQIFHPEDETDYFDPVEIQENKAIAVLASIPILFWLPLVACQGWSSYGRFCANQGLILLVVNIALSVVQSILGTVLRFIPGIGGVVAGLLGLLVGVAGFAAFLLLLISAFQGKARRIPLIGRLFEAFQ